MMKLELKHLAAYLPYGLNVLNMHILHADKGIVSIGHILTTESKKYKPILRPLSDLIKEIEHNGDNFVPIVELVKFRYFDILGAKAIKSFDPTLINIESSYWRVIGDYDMEYFNVSILIRPEDMHRNDYWIVQKLLEWHFDVFGLIDAGLAVDINTLNKPTNE